MARPKILCVDDKEEHLHIRKLLLEQFGCDVVTAPNGPACLKTLAEQSADLVLIDYHLTPEMDGEALARTIRLKYPNLPLIMLTGDIKVPDSVRESVDLLLIKGNGSPRDLLDAIERLVPDATLRPRRAPF